MKRMGFTIVALLALVAAAPGQLDAQGRGAQGRGASSAEIDRSRGGDIWDIIRGDSRSRGNSSAAGPPFCQNGQGHPVHGRDWCRQQGFSAGGLGDIIFRSPRRGGRLDQRGIIDQIGDIVFRQIQAQSYALGSREPLHGTWGAGPGRGQTLTIRSGNLIIAELLDETADGNVDIFRLRRAR